MLVNKTITHVQKQKKAMSPRHSAQCKIALKELRNRISHVIRLWSLFCSILVYASLHFLLIHLENYFSLFCAFCLLCLFCVKIDVIFIHFITFAQSFFGYVVCVFVLTYEKQFVNVIKIWVQFLIKNMPLESFWTFKF